MNHAGSTSLLVAYRYELYEAQVLSNGIYVPKSYWRHILSINVLSCIMFNSYGLITAIKEQYNKEDHINSLQRVQSLISTRLKNISFKGTSNQSDIWDSLTAIPFQQQQQQQQQHQIQIYPRHTVSISPMMQASVSVSPFTSASRSQSASLDPPYAQPWCEGHYSLSPALPLLESTHLAGSDPRGPLWSSAAVPNSQHLRDCKILDDSFCPGTNGTVDNSSFNSDRNEYEDVSKDQIHLYQPASEESPVFGESSRVSKWERFECPVEELYALVNQDILLPL